MARNTLNDGLTAAWYFNTPASPYPDLIGARSAFLAGGTEPTRNDGPTGGSMNLPAGHGIIRPNSLQSDIIAAGSLSWTVATICQLDTISTFGVIAQVINQFVIANVTGGFLRCLVDPGDGFDTHTTTATIPTGEFVFLGLSWDGATASLYINETVETFSSPAAPSAKANGQMHLTSNTDTVSASGEWIGRLDSFYSWDRTLSDAEMASMAAQRTSVALESVKQTRNAVSRINSKFPGILARDKGLDAIEILDKRPDSRATSPLLKTPDLKTLTYGEIRATFGPQFLPADPST